MDTYKWLNSKKTTVQKNETESISYGGRGWNDFILYQEGGGIVEPFRTHDEWVVDALGRLWAKHDSIVAENGLSDISKTTKEQAKLNKALRKETKGQATAKDIELLDNEDILDTWFDEMETAGESNDHGEQWIEDPVRTEQELIDYDPALVPWPVYPF